MTDTAKWPLYLTTTYNDSSLETYNFAMNGATVDRAIVPHGSDFVHQYLTFLETYWSTESGAPSWNSSNTLFAAFFGINDINAALETSKKAERKKIVKIFKTYSTLLDKVSFIVLPDPQTMLKRTQLYKLGARNFLIMNTPPLERYPSSESDDRKAAVVAWNARAARMAAKLRTKYKDTTVFLFDTHALFSKVLHDPRAFSQTAKYIYTTAACDGYAGKTVRTNYSDPSCGVPLRYYLWHDNLHPTYPIQEAIAAQIAGTLRNK